MSILSFSFAASHWRKGLAAAVLACAPAWAMAAEAPLKVMTSFSILQDMVREIGGDAVSVDTLVGPGGDAHTFEPTPSDSRRLKAARLLVVNGLAFELWLPRLVKASGYEGATVIASEGVTPRKFVEGAGHESAHGQDDDHDHDHDHGHDHHGDFDPHAWQSLSNGVIYAQNIIQALAKADPAHAEGYRQRGEAYIARLKTLDAQIHQTFDAIPADRRAVVTSHDAFGYFGDAYGIRFLAVSGMSTQAEPSASELAGLIKTVRDTKVPAVFVESIQSPKLVETVARETGAKVGGTLYSDALAAPGESAGTYAGMFEWNVRQLAEAMRP